MNYIKQYAGYVVAAFLLIMYVQTCQKGRADIARLESNVKIAQDSVIHYRDKNGQLVSERQSMQLTLRDLKNQHSQLGIDRDRLAIQVGGLSNLVTYYKGKVNSVGTGTVSHSIDTVIKEVAGRPPLEAKAFHFNNGFLKLDQEYFPRQDSLHISYKYFTDLEMTAYRKKAGLFGPRQLFVDVRFSDPNTTMKEAKSLQIVESPKKWWQTDAFKIGVSVVGGFWLAKQL